MMDANLISVFLQSLSSKKKERKSNKKWKWNEAITYLYHGVFEASIMKPRHGFLKNILKLPNEAKARIF